MSSTIKLIRYTKRTLLRLGVHNFLPASVLKKSGYTADLSKWIRKYKGELTFTSFPYSGFDNQLRYKLYEHLITTEDLDNQIDYLEFGVSKGASFRWWVENIKHVDARFFGFDTFTGLPEDWGHFKAGDMSNGNEPPKIEGSRHTFYQGLFQDTLPKFMKTYNSDNRKIIHLDADIFSATLFVLTTFSHLIKPGDILLFDEFNVPTHEFMAFKHWTESFYINYTVLGEVNNFYQTAIRIN